MYSAYVYKYECGYKNSAQASHVYHAGHPSSFRNYQQALAHQPSAQLISDITWTENSYYNLMEGRLVSTSGYNDDDDAN